MSRWALAERRNLGRGERRAKRHEQAASQIASREGVDDRQVGPLGRGQIRERGRRFPPRNAPLFLKGGTRCRESRVSFLGLWKKGGGKKEGQDRRLPRSGYRLACPMKEKATSSGKSVVTRRTPCRRRDRRGFFNRKHKRKKKQEENEN